MIELPPQFSYLCKGVDKWGKGWTDVDLRLLMEKVGFEEGLEIQSICAEIENRNQWGELVDWVRGMSAAASRAGGFNLRCFLKLVEELSESGTIAPVPALIEAIKRPEVKAPPDWKTVPNNFKYLADAAAELHEMCGDEDPMDCLEELDRSTRRRLKELGKKIVSSDDLEAFRIWLSSQEDEALEATRQIMVLLDVLEELEFI